MATLTTPNSAPLTYTGRFVVPGDKLYTADGPHESGEGTYTVHNAIHASLAGYVMLRQKVHFCEALSCGENTFL